MTIERNWEEKTTKNRTMKKLITIQILALFIVSVCKAQDISAYQSYIEKVEKRVENLSEERKNQRQLKLVELKDNPFYKKLVDKKIVSVDYISIINAVSYSLGAMTKDGFTLTEDIAEDLENKGFLNFTIGIIMLSQPLWGGIPKEFIQVFERYKQTYGYYGTVQSNYDFSLLFGVLNPKDRGVLNAIYEAKEEELSTWANEDNSEEGKEPIYSYLYSLEGFEEYVKQLYPYFFTTLKVKSIISVYDGDTFTADLDCNCEMDIFCNKISIRILGVDAPEIRRGCLKEKELAIRAKQFSADFLSKGEITLKNIDRGKYFRIVADVFVNGKPLSKELIKRELAVSYDGKTKIKDWCNTE